MPFKHLHARHLFDLEVHGNVFAEDRVQPCVQLLRVRMWASEAGIPLAGASPPSGFYICVRYAWVLICKSVRVLVEVKVRDIKCK